MKLINFDINIGGFIPNRFYGLLYEYQIIDDNLIKLEFDVFGNIHIEDNLSNTLNHINNLKYSLISHLNDNNTGILEINLNKNIFNKIFNINLDSIDSIYGNWYEFPVSNNGVEFIFYSTNKILSNDESTDWILGFIDIDKIRIFGDKNKDVNKLNKYRKMFNIKKYINNNNSEMIEEVGKLLESFSKKAEYITPVSLNVDQANASVFLDQNDKTELFYFDIGRSHSKKNNILNNSIINNPSKLYIISHHHYDHYGSLIDMSIGVNEPYVVLPLNINIILGPFVYRTISKICNKYKNVVWVDKTEVIKISNDVFRFHFVESKVNDANNNGIILSCHLGKKADISNILFPADARYNNCKLIQPYDAICVSHHGGKMAIDDKLPNPTNNLRNFTAYSYGMENIYGHPHQDTIKKHSEAGWGDCDKSRKNTINGSIVYSFGNVYEINKKYQTKVQKYSTSLKTKINEIL